MISHEKSYSMGSSVESAYFILTSNAFLISKLLRPVLVKNYSVVIFSLCTAPSHLSATLLSCTSLTSGTTIGVLNLIEITPSFVKLSITGYGSDISVI